MSIETIELKTLDASGNSVAGKSVAASCFAGKVRENLLHEVVRWQRAKRRAGTHSVQTRAEMTGGGAKPWRQKGTGRARAGSNTSPLWVGGGVAHGPKQRSYEFSVNKKERRQALVSAVSARNKEGRLIVIDDFKLKGVKTSAAAKVLAAVGVPSRQSAVVITDAKNETLLKSLRNIEGVRVLAPEGLNVYDILNAKYLVIAADALEAVEARLRAKAQ